MKHWTWLTGFGLTVSVWHGAVLAQEGHAPLVAEPPPPFHGETLRSWGTGFFVDRAGHILTAHHVVASCGDIAVVGGKRQNARLLGSSATDDLSLLRVAEPAGEPVAFDSHDRAPRGALVIILSYPNLNTALLERGQGRILFNGIVLDTAAPRHVALMSNTKPGGSGSPVLGVDGLVIGIVESMETRSGAAVSTLLPREFRLAVSSLAIRDFLRQQGVVPIEGRDPAQRGRNAIDVLAASEVEVECLGNRPGS